MSAAEFCRRNGIAASSFFAWKRRLGPAAAAFVEGKLVDDKSSRSVTSPVGASDSSTIDVCLRGGRRVRVRRGFDHALLAEVVAAMEAMS